MCAILERCPCGTGGISDELLYLSQLLVFPLHLMSKSLKLFFLVADKTLHPLLEDFLLCMFFLTHLTLCIQLMEEWKREKGEEGM